MLTWKVRTQGSKALLGENCFENCPGFTLWLWLDVLLPLQSPHKLSHDVLLEEFCAFCVTVVSADSFATALLYCCSYHSLPDISLLGFICSLKTKEKKILVLHLAGLCGSHVLGFALPLFDFSMFCLILNSNPIFEEKVFIFHTEWHYLWSS